jgi:AraC-like DNA-binding protein
MRWAGEGAAAAVVASPGRDSCVQHEPVSVPSSVRGFPPPLQMVAEFQVGHAKELMMRGVPLADVADRCGFSNQSHFTARFKQLTGETPARWRRLQAQKRRRPLGGMTGVTHATSR